MTDIVTLLRKYQPYSKLHGQAANEIERLRAELSHWRSQYDSAMNLMREIDAQLEQFHHDYNMIDVVARYGDNLEKHWEPERYAEFKIQLDDAEQRHRSYEWNLIMKKQVSDDE